MKGFAPIELIPPLEPMTAADEARVQVSLMGMELMARAADACAQAMNLQNNSARLEQLAEICTDEKIVQIRDTFISEGVLKMLPPLSSFGGEA